LLGPIDLLACFWYHLCMPTQTTTARKTLNLGKVDYNGRGRKINAVDITWSIDDNGRFSMWAGIWNGNHTDYITCGQMVDEVAKLFPHNKKVQRMAQIWERWNLNDMRAGSSAQESWLRANPITVQYPESHYEKASKALADAWLNPDESCPNPETGEGYKYGSAWKMEELPDDVKLEINSW